MCCIQVNGKTEKHTSAQFLFMSVSPSLCLFTTWLDIYIPSSFLMLVGVRCRMERVCSEMITDAFPREVLRRKVSLFSEL